MPPRVNIGNTSGFSPNEDFTSPYYLHPSDNPGLQLVSHVLTGSNYMNWSRSVVTALLAKNKLHFVNGMLPKPAGDDLLFHAWVRCNSMVVSWLRNSISSQICTSIMFHDDAFQIWLDLKERFSICDAAKTYQLRQQIMALSQGSLDVTAYYTNLRSVWDEYRHSLPIAWCSCTTCRCDSTAKWNAHQNQECTIQFLIGLNPSYSQLRSAILAMVPLPNLSKAFSLVLQEERQRSIGRNSPTLPPSSDLPYATNAATSGYSRGRSCSHCRKPNHTMDRCYALHGFPPGFGRGRGKSSTSQFISQSKPSINYVDEHNAEYFDKSISSDDIDFPSVDQYQKLITMLKSQKLAVTTGTASSSSQIPDYPPSAAQITSSPNHPPPSPSFTGTTIYSPFIASIFSPSTQWLLDTGATHHVCCNISLFTNSSPVSNAAVNLPNGATASVTHVGTVTLTPHITLNNVLCVPSFSFNLISVSSLTTSLSCYVKFTHDSLEI